MRCHSSRGQPTVRSTSTPSTTRISVGTVSIVVVPAHRQVGVVGGVDAGRERRVVLGVHGDAGQRAEQRGHHPAALALLLDDDDEAVGQHGRARPFELGRGHALNVLPGPCDTRHEGSRS